MSLSHLTATETKATPKISQWIILNNKSNPTVSSSRNSTTINHGHTSTSKYHAKRTMDYTAASHQSSHHCYTIISTYHEVSVLSSHHQQKLRHSAVRTEHVLRVTSPVSHLTETSFTTHSVQYIQYTMFVHLSLL